MTVKEFVMKSAFSFRLQLRQFLIKLNVSIINDSEGVWDEVCF